MALCTRMPVCAGHVEDAVAVVGVNGGEEDVMGI